MISWGLGSRGAGETDGRILVAPMCGENGFTMHACRSRQLLTDYQSCGSGRRANPRISGWLSSRRPRLWNPNLKKKGGDDYR